MKKTTTEWTESEKEIVRRTETYVERQLYEDVTGHDFHHILRVAALARKIAMEENGDLFLVRMAALLHDVDDPKVVGRADSQKAKTFLAALDPEKKTRLDVPKILDILDNLSYTSTLQGKRETTLEGQIVQDADRLDALGAIGIARTFAYGGFKRRPIYAGLTDDESSVAHFHQKLLKLEGLMNTKTGKKWAKERSRYLKEFLDRFQQDWNLEGPLPPEGR